MLYKSELVVFSRHLSTHFVAKSGSIEVALLQVVYSLLVAALSLR